MTRPLPGFALLTLTALCWPLALNIFLPAMPAIAESLAVPYTSVQTAFSLSLLTLGIGQVVYGPLLDRYGRRPNLLGGLVLYIVGSGMAMLATGIDMLVAGRALQAFGACATMVAPRAMLRDILKGNAARALSRMAMVISTITALAPTIGGLALTYFSWRSTFGISLLLGLVLFAWCWLRAGETLPDSERRTVTMAILVQEYKKLLVNPQYLSYVAIMTFTSTSFYSFLAMSPRLFIADLGVSPTNFGLCTIGMAGGILLGNTLATRQVMRRGVDGMIGFVLPLSTAGLLVMLALSPWPGVFTILIPMFVYATAHGAIFPPAYAGSLEVDPRVVGAAAAFSGFVNFVVVGILTLTLAQWHDGTGFPLAVLCLCGNLIVWSSFLLARRLRRVPDRMAA